MKHCFICGQPGSDKAHIISRGAGGSDEDYNIILLCRTHHSNQHYIGWKQFSIMFPCIESELIKRGFKRCEIKGSWYHPKERMITEKRSQRS